MTAEQTSIYEKFVSGVRAGPNSTFSLAHPDGGLIGPPNAWLLSPKLGAVLERLGGTLRFDLTLSRSAAEIAILRVAHHHHSAFEKYAHVQAAASAGLSEIQIEALVTGGPAQFATAEQTLVDQSTQAMLAHGSLNAAEYDAALAELGQQGLLELVVLIGYYQLLALQLAVFEVSPPD
jgi:4-carboxymuconolactone decarboxylase